MDLLHRVGQTEYYDDSDKLGSLMAELQKRDKKIIHLAEGAMNKYQNQRKDKEQEWKEAWLMRHGKRIGGYYQSNTQLSSTEVHNACRTVSSRLRDILFGEEEWFDLHAPQMLAEASEVYKTYMEIQFDNDGIYDRGYDLMDDLCTYGNCYVKTVWGINRKKHKRTYWVAHRKEKYPGVYSGIEYKRETIDVDESIFDNIHVERVSPWNLYFDMTIPDLKNQNIIIEVIECSWRHLQNLSKQNMGEDGLYDLRDEYKVLSADYAGKNEVERKILEKEGVGDEEGSGTTGTKVHSIYRLWQMYFYYDINEDGVDELCMSTLLVSGANYKVVIQRPIEFPYEYEDFPYDMAGFDSDANVAYADGIPALCRENHIVLSDNYSRMHDNATYRTNNMWLMERGSGLLPTYLTYEANKVVPIDRVEGFKTLAPEDMTMSHLGIHKFAVEDIRQTSGGLSTLQGLPSRHGTTAKEASQILAQANVTVVDIVKSVERTLIERMLEKASSLVRQFKDNKELAQYIGPKGLKNVEFEPWRVRGKCVFRAVGSVQVQNRLLFAQQLLNLLSQVPNLPPGMLKVSAILKEWLQMIGIKNVDKFVSSVEDEDLVKPSDENVLMNQGHKPVIHPKDDDMAHLAIHLAGVQICPPESVQIYQDHIQETQEKIMREQQKALMMQGASSAGGIGVPGGRNYQPTGREPLQHLPQTERGIEMQGERKNVLRGIGVSPTVTEE